MNQEPAQLQDLHFDDIRKAMSASFEVTLSSESIKAFALISGDQNPLHVDTEYARSVGHPSPVAHGLLTSSFFSRLVGMYLPGKYALIHRVDVEFRNPVYAGDILTVSGEVTDVHESVRQIEIKALITNQDQKRVSVGKIKVGMLK